MILERRESKERQEFCCSGYRRRRKERRGIGKSEKRWEGVREKGNS